MSRAKKNKPTDKAPVTFIDKEPTLAELKYNKIKINFKNERQQEYWDAIDENEVIICKGPAGTGKSYIMAAKALDLLCHQKRFDKIIIVRPAVEAEEKLGFLPGDINEKLDPYVFPTFYLFNKILGERKVNKMKDRGLIQVMALAYMRGVNIDKAIVIFEEAQNATPRQMKTFLTRLGEDSKYIISGDLDQSDRYADKTKTGLHIAFRDLKDKDVNIATVEFDDEHIVRNPLVKVILENLNV